MKRRGISPVVATVLLVAMVIVIALIIFLWFRGMRGETCTKFGGTNVEVVCGQVEFSADYSGGQLQITNLGNVPIFGMKVKVQNGGNYVSKDLSDSSFATGWPGFGLDQGAAFASALNFAGSPDSITLTPILMGTCDSGEKAHICDENQHGKEIAIF